ncbi:MAG: hypothetical protein K2L47_02045, partial [Clostridia bacterium]|nr:hypothetical protein [Clostridia bacterium]
MSSAIVSIFVSPNEVLALTSTSSAVKAGNGAELWNSESSTFNNVVINDLVDKLFGNEDPVEYIKKSKDTQTDSYVVPASTINTKVGNATDGMVVKLDGKEWIVASLTLADIDGQNDNVVMTLYLANADGSSVFNSTTGSGKKGDNAYSRSDIRNHLLTDSKWSLFNQTGEDSFASQFLVQPKYIAYQQSQTVVGRDSAYKYHLSNEALDLFTSGWNPSFTDYYKPSDTFTDNNGVSQKYDAWGNDYIWLPSLTETGATNRCNAGANSVWKLSANQTAHSGATSSWWRSGNTVACDCIYYLQGSGAYNYSDDISSTLGVRPAIHLNLSNIAMGLATPQDLETTYNGNEQTIKSIATATKADWYDKDIYEHV